MDTHLINSQFLSRRDIRVWFWDGGQEYLGECRAIAENGILMHVKMKRPADGTVPDPAKFLPAVRKSLVGKKLAVEASSPKTRGELKIQVEQVDVVSAKKELLSVVGTFTQTPDPRFLKLLLEPVILKAPRKE
ncbi:MAG TPA: hypothetical protein VNO22_09950 [Planctomycetota bacterium]|jgi:hypothetical protein|nr:hypothetical protein [Planctomycetota bacterium]